MTGDHNCPLAPTYATVDATTYCGHPSHDWAVPSWVETHAFFSELHQAMCCGN